MTDLASEHTGTFKYTCLFQSFHLLLLLTYFHYNGAIVKDYRHANLLFRVKRSENFFSIDSVKRKAEIVFVDERFTKRVATTRYYWFGKNGYHGSMKYVARSPFKSWV